ncbi:MAG: hypothetical protein WA354_19175 [Terracidiphilus sp.]
MNWRRGLLLAGINLMTAVPLICLLAARDAQYLKERQQHSANEEGLRIGSFGDISAAPTEIVQAQDEQTVSFSPCGLWGHIPPQVSVVQIGNLPAFIVSQWREECPPKWSVAKMLGVNDSGLLSDADLKTMRRVDVALCVLIAVQWFLIGSLPLIQARRWWAEPGAFITVCTAIASGVALLPGIDALARLPALIAFGGWVWWLGLLLWIPVHIAWQSTVGGLRRLNN